MFMVNVGLKKTYMYPMGTYQKNGVCFKHPDLSKHNPLKFLHKIAAIIHIKFHQSFQVPKMKKSSPT